jgi:hypothetical protein
VIGFPIALVAAAASFSVLALAEPSQAVDVHIVAVQASPTGPSDVQLLQLRPRLRRLVGYRSFRIIQQERRECAWRSRAAFSIPGGRALYIVPKAMRDEAVAMQVQLLDGTRALVDTDVRLQNRGVILLGVEPTPQTDDGALIIMLKAEE